TTQYMQRGLCCATAMPPNSYGLYFRQLVSQLLEPKVFRMQAAAFTVVGRRFRLNPLAVTLALLFWAWIWGAMGLILAIPMVAATKIICDYTDSLRGLGQWLGD